MSDKRLRNHEINVWYPGNFDFITPGHMQLFEECHQKFKNVKLMVGIQEDNDNPSLLTTQEKVEALSHIYGVDQVVISGEPPSKPHFILNPNSQETPDDIAVHPISGVDSDELIARVIKDYEKFVDLLLEMGYSPKLIGLSKTDLAFLKLKKQLKRLDFSFKKLQLINTEGVKHAITGIRQMMSNYSSRTYTLCQSAAHAFRDSIGGGLNRLFRRVNNSQNGQL